jgi:hypothetical protein
VKNGVPIDVAFQLDDTMRAAMAIAFSEFNGAEFDVDRMRFKERRK